MKNKISTAIKCVYAAVAIQLMTAIYSGVKVLSIVKVFEGNQFEILEAIVPGLVWSGMLAAAAFWAVKEMKAKTAFGWGGCLAVFMFVLTTPAVLTGREFCYHLQC